MGRIYLEKNGQTTIYFNGENVSGFTPSADTYYVGTNLGNGHYGKLNPNGDYIDFELTGSSGGGYTTIDVATLQTLISTSGLTEGSFYKITGANSGLFGGTDIILQSTSSNGLAPRGVGLFYNSNFNDSINIWSNMIYLNNISSEVNFTSNEDITGDGGQTGVLVGLPDESTICIIPTAGDWSTISSISGDSSTISASVSVAVSPNYNVGDKVNWGGYIWENLNGLVGASTSVFTLDSEWSKVEYNTTDYTFVQNTIDYEPLYDNISYRFDGFNEVLCPQIAIDTMGLSFNTIRAFPWGRALGCNFQPCGISNMVNIPFTMIDIKMGPSSRFSAQNWGDNSTQLTNITLGFGSIINKLTLTPNGTFSQIKLDDNAAIRNVVVGSQATFNNVQLGQESFIDGIDLYANSQFRSMFLAPSFDNQTTNVQSITLYENAGMFNITMDSGASMDKNTCLAGGRIRDIKMGYNSFINDTSVGENGDLFNVVLAGGSQYGPWTRFSFIENLTIGVATYAHDINLELGSYIENISLNNFSRFRYLNLTMNSYISDFTANGDNVTVEDIELGTHSDIAALTLNEGAYFGEIVMGHGAVIENVSLAPNAYMAMLKLEPNAEVFTITVGSTGNAGFSDCYLGVDTEIDNIDIGDNSYFQYLNLALAANVNYITLTNNATLTDITIGEGLSLNSITIDSTITSKIIDHNNNNFPAILDITGQPTIDVNLVRYAGEILVTSSNSGETISQISNLSFDYPVKFIAQNELILTINGTPKASIGSAAEIVMTVPTIVLSGATDDFIIVKNNGNYVQELDTKNYI